MARDVVIDEIGSYVCGIVAGDRDDARPKRECCAIKGDCDAEQLGRELAEAQDASVVTPAL